MLTVWDDRATIAHALAFEAALARAQADEGLIAAEQADAVERACAAVAIDGAELADEAAHAGTLAIPLVRRLRRAVGEAGDVVHLGATSQDLADTVLVMQIRAATDLLLADAARIAEALRPVAERHAATTAVGRTLLRDALPIGFGLRVAHWRLGIAQAARRLRAEAAANGVVQLGGPVGTRAGLGDRGAAVAARVADTLGLAIGPPWHARRGGMAAVAAAVGILVGALAKMARDTALLGQDAVGEVREPLVSGRGGSSAMAHKRNPTGAQVALTAAIRAPGLVAGMLGALPAELERPLGGWQAEGPLLAELFLLASGAADAIAVVAEELEIAELAIARNVAASGLGDDLGESVAITADLLARGD